MISIPSFAPSASKPHDKDAKREQNPHYTRYNGLKRLCGRSNVGRSSAGRADRREPEALNLDLTSDELIYDECQRNAL